MQYSIGTTFEGRSESYLTALIPFVDYIEVTPDAIVSRENGRTLIKAQILNFLVEIQKEYRLPILLHGVGLSIGSADSWSNDYLEILDQLFAALPNIEWHSEHLGYTMINGEMLGTMLTLPKTEEALDLVCSRVFEIQRRYQIPFLLENVISMFPESSDDYSDAEFLNNITSQTGCGLILDVYNLECDQHNFGIDINNHIDSLNLDAVYELHLAGGSTDPEFNFKMDIHEGLTARSTLDLAKRIISRKPSRLRAVTFEILDDFISHDHPETVINELKRIREEIN